MNYDQMQLRRYSHSGSFTYPHCFYPTDRNTPLAVSHATRPDPRGCPVSGRGRMNMGRDEPGPETTQTRRRIAVACARCRKRKIRCSGDPGNGSGCQNCRSSGADISQCQFHRVGSAEISNVMATYGLGNGLGSAHNGMMMYSGSNSLCNRPFPPNSYSGINTKVPYPASWTVPGSEEASPVADSYGVEQNYLPSQNTMPNIYGDNVRWNQQSQKQFSNGTGTYFEQDPTMTSSCATNGLPYIPTASMRQSMPGEALSPLSMTSLQTTLPVHLADRPHQRQMADSAVPQRHLPIPQRSRGHATANTVDQMQTRALPPTHIGNGTSSMGTNSEYLKAAMGWNTDASGSEIQSSNILDGSTSELGSSSNASGAAVNDAVLAYATASSPDSPEPTTTSSGPPLNFSTSTLLETMVAPAVGTTYSDFRSYRPPASSSTERASILSSDCSHSGIYSFSTDHNPKNDSFGEMTGESTLVSGKPYSPLGHSPSQNAAAYSTLRRDSFNNRNAPTNQSSISNLNRSY